MVEDSKARHSAQRLDKSRVVRGSNRGVEVSTSGVPGVETVVVSPVFFESIQVKPIRRFEEPDFLDGDQCRVVGASVLPFEDSDGDAVDPGNVGELPLAPSQAHPEIENTLSPWIEVVIPVQKMVDIVLTGLVPQ